MYAGKLVQKFTDKFINHLSKKMDLPEYFHIKSHSSETRYIHFDAGRKWFIVRVSTHKHCEENSHPDHDIILGDSISDEVLERFVKGFIKAWNRRKLICCKCGWLVEVNQRCYLLNPGAYLGSTITEKYFEERINGDKQDCEKFKEFKDGSRNKEIS